MVPLGDSGSTGVARETRARGERKGGVKIEIYPVTSVLALDEYLGSSDSDPQSKPSNGFSTVYAEVKVNRRL